jgi:hypothetical protein
MWVTHGHDVVLVGENLRNLKRPYVSISNSDFSMLIGVGKLLKSGFSL